MPTTRPQSLWPHSIQYICLNSSKFIRLLSCLNSGLSLYLANSCSQASSSRGGKEPVTGRHSVILRPDSVRRVNPPKTTIPKTLAAEPSSQYATDLELVSGHDEALCVFPEGMSALLMLLPNAPSGELEAGDVTEL